MKKKLLIALVLTLCAMFTLTACLQLENVSNLQLVDAPKTTFAVGEATADTITFTVSVDRGTEKILFHYPDDAAKISLSGFSTAEAGTFTATISYKVSEANVLTYTFEYTVTDGFAGGDGSEETPYLIASADQFMMIPFADQQADGYTYYKLTADINLTGADLDAYQAAMETFVFNGELNGLKANGVGSYKIIGYTSAKNFVAEGKNYGMGLFGLIGNAAFKNIEIVDASVEAPLAEGAGIIGVGRSDTKLDGLSEDDQLVFENVTVSGSIAAGENVGALVGRVRKYAAVTVYNVVNNANVTALTSYTAGALGSLSGKPVVIVNGYTNNGNITAVNHAAALIGNVNVAANITMNNVTNNGIITSPANGSVGAILAGLGAKPTIVATNVKNNGTVVVPANYTKEAADSAYVQANMIKKLDVLEAAIVDGYLTITDSVEGAAYYRASMSAVFSCYGADGKVVKSEGGTSFLFAEEMFTGNKTANTKVTAIKAAYNATYKAAFEAEMAAEGVAAGYANGTYVSPANANGVWRITANKQISWTVTAFDAEGKMLASAIVSYEI